MRWTPERMDQLERAVRDMRRVALRRRGTEYVIVAERLGVQGTREALIGRLPMTGDVLTFTLDEIERFEIV